MLQIEDYKEQITNLYLEGKSAIEISRILNFRYHQPVYNFFKKNGWERKGIHTYRKYTLDEDFFKVIDSEEKAYILGFICADGHIDYNRIKIGVSIKDKEILEKIRKALKSNANISSSLRKSNNSVEETMVEVETQKDQLESIIKEIKNCLLGQEVRSIEFSPDGRFLVTGAFDAKIRIFDRENDFELIRKVDHGDKVVSSKY